MSNWAYLFAALATGIIVPFQIAFNAQLGGVTKNPYTAGLIVFVVGAFAFTLLLAIIRPTWPSVTELMAAPITIWLGGLIATLYILGTVVVTPKLGVGLTIGLILIGQLVAGLLLDHFGAFGNLQNSLNGWRLLGLALMIGGVVMIKTH